MISGAVMCSSKDFAALVGLSTSINNLHFLLVVNFSNSILCIKSTLLIELITCKSVWPSHLAFCLSEFAEPFTCMSFHKNKVVPVGGANTWLGTQKLKSKLCALTYNFLQLQRITEVCDGQVHKWLSFYWWSSFCIIWDLWHQDRSGVQLD